MKNRVALGVTCAMTVVAVTLASAAWSAPQPMSGSISLNYPATSTASSTAWPALGNSVTFSTSYSKNVKNPRIDLRCYQNGALVYAEGGSYDHTFVLGGAWSQWMATGGPANCTAALYDLVWNGNNAQQVYFLSSTSFAAAG